MPVPHVPPGFFPANIFRVAVILSLLFLLPACSPAESRKSDDVILPARVEKVEYKTLSDRLVFAGTVASRYETAMAFRVGGKMVSRRIEVGSVVQPGMVLAELDGEDMRLSIQAARAKLAAAEATYAQTAADLQRYKELRNGQSFAKATYDQRLAAAQSDEARLKQARSELQIAERQFDYTVMRADGMGVVTSLSAEVGQVVAQGQTIMKVASTSALDIVVSIPEQDLEEIRTAERTVFTLWANPDKSGPENFHIAHLREVAPGADPATRTYTAKFTISNPPDLIRIGMSATLIIEQRAKHPVAELPLSALFQDEGQPAFWVLDPVTNCLVLKPVTAGATHEIIQPEERACTRHSRRPACDAPAC